ncbi:protein-L-isoaspartate O-methyltransferase [Bradyrhizobium sp. GM6.1]
MDDTLAAARRWYAEDLRYKVPILRNPRLIEAFASVPREQFVGPGTWRIISDPYSDAFLGPITTRAGFIMTFSWRSMRVATSTMECPASGRAILSISTSRAVNACFSSVRAPDTIPRCWVRLSDPLVA